MKNECLYCHRLIEDDEALLCLYCGQSLKKPVGLFGKIKYISPKFVLFMFIFLIIAGFLTLLIL